MHRRYNQIFAEDLRDAAARLALYHSTTVAGYTSVSKEA